MALFDMPLRKRILLAVGLAVLSLALLRVYAVRPERCQEAAFQQSSAYGSSPRRFFEISQESRTNDVVPTLTYFISAYDLPITRISVSSFDCAKVGEELLGQNDLNKGRDTPH